VIFYLLFFYSLSQLYYAVSSVISLSSCVDNVAILIDAGVAQHLFDLLTQHDYYIIRGASIVLHNLSTASKKEDIMKV
jgi:hypothetical protein